MASLHITIRQDKKRPKKTIIEFDADKFERLAAAFGFFNPEFLKSLDRPEKDIKAGRAKRLRSLKDLR